MEKTFLLYLSAHWGDLIEQIKKVCHIHFKEQHIMTEQPRSHNKQSSKYLKKHD